MTAWIGGHRRWIWLVAGVLVLALLILGVIRALTAGASEKPKAAATAIVDTGTVTTEVATSGTLQPAQTRSLTFAVDGTVESVAVRAGSVVTAGQDLAKVDDTDAKETVSTARESLDEAESALDDARDSADSATSKPASSCAGANVPAAYPSPSVSASASASPSPSSTRTATPRPTKTQPTKTQPKPPAATTKTVPRAPTTTCAAAGNGSAQGGANGQGGATGGGGDAVLSAQQRVTQANVTLENAEDALAGTTITAPIAGKILSVAGKVGTQVSSGSTFITLADVYDMQISADFPEADADRLALRQKATVTLADRAGKTFAATVVQVDPTGTSDGTMVRYGVVLSFTEPPKDLLVGQSAAVRVTTGSATGVLRVPNTALHDVAGTSGTVLKPVDGGTSQIKVGIGLRGDQYTQIKSGLAAGETVVRSW